MVIRVIRPGEEEVEEVQLEAMPQTLGAARIRGESVMVGTPGPEVLAEQSGDASLVSLPFRLPDNRPVGPA